MTNGKSVQTLHSVHSPVIHSPAHVTNQAPIRTSIKLPKVRADGEPRITTIHIDEISGHEPCLVKFEGKTYEGSKIYVDHGRRFFKVLASDAAVNQVWVEGLQTGQPVAILPGQGIVNLPQLTQKKMMLLAAKVDAK